MSDDLSTRLVDALAATYGAHAGHRAAHAKGVLCAGTFTATPEAATLSRAPHLTGDTLRAHVRFSNGSGDPANVDAVRDGRGMAVKVYLPDESTTDILAITLPAFFVRTPEDLIEFNAARRPDPETGQLDMDKVGAFLGEHPETVPAVMAAISAPCPASYARLRYNALHAFGFVDADDTLRWGRYTFEPETGEASVPEEETGSLDPEFLAAELAARLESGPAVFFLDVTLAAEGDPLDDPTAEWPAERPRIRVGRLEITELVFDRERGGDVLVFDPTRVPDGIILSDDAILHARPGAYAVSVARRTARSGG